MSVDCYSPDDETDGADSLVCPECESESRSVSHETLYHQVKPFVAREVTSEQTYGVCRSCSVFYFSTDQQQIWNSTDVRTTVGFKQAENEPSHPVWF